MSVQHTVLPMTRYRVLTRWFRKPVLVLQVKVQVKGYAPDQFGGDDVDYTYWRDAQLEDMNYVVHSCIRKEGQE